MLSSCQSFGLYYCLQSMQMRILHKLDSTSQGTMLLTMHDTGYGYRFHFVWSWLAAFAALFPFAWQGFLSEKLHFHLLLLVSSELTGFKAWCLVELKWVQCALLCFLGFACLKGEVREFSSLWLHIPMNISF